MVRILFSVFFLQVFFYYQKHFIQIFFQFKMYFIKSFYFLFIFILFFFNSCFYLYLLTVFFFLFNKILSFLFLAKHFMHYFLSFFINHSSHCVLMSGLYFEQLFLAKNIQQVIHHEIGFILHCLLLCQKKKNELKRKIQAPHFIGICRVAETLLFIQES